MEEYSLIVGLPLKVFLIISAHIAWFARDVMAATLDDTNKSISLLWELDPISYKFLQKNSIVLSSNMAALSHGCEPRIPLGH